MTASTTHAPSAVTSFRGMTRTRKIALWGGVMYLITFVASIPQLKLFAQVIDDPTGYITHARSNTALQLGSWLEIVTALSGIGTAVALYPMTKRVSATAAIGFVTSRVVEAAMIIVGVMSMLTVVTLQGDFAGHTGTDAHGLGLTGEALVAMRQWTFLLGPGIMPGINALFLGYVMYRSRLVPRLIPTLGLIGAPLILVSATGTIFGAWDQVSGTGFVLALPIAVWEFSLGMWLTVKGFNRTPLTD